MKPMMAALAAVCLTVAPVAAQDLQPWGEAAGWDIAIDPTLNNGCLMGSEFDDGSQVRIGFDMNPDGGGYILSMNEQWGDIVEGQSYPITIALDDTTFEGEATGLYLDGMPGADVVVHNGDFFAKLAEARSLVLSHDGTEVMSLDIAGSADAIVALVQCQDEQVAKAGG